MEEDRLTINVIKIMTITTNKRIYHELVSSPHAGKRINH